MKKIIYVTEPEVINIKTVEGLLSSDYEVMQGNTSFAGVPTDCTTIIIRSGTTITSAIFEKIPKLAHIIRIGTGVDAIDIDFCNKNNIAVHNAPGANADAVSDYVIAMIFGALRKIHTLSRKDIETWNRFKFTGHNMSSRSIGIIGFGNIGKQIFHKLKNFGCTGFYVYDPFVDAKDLPQGVTPAASVEEVLEKSNIATLHVPLIPSTKYLINKDNLHLLGRGSILVNASRGGIVNENDVIEYTEQNDLIYIADTVENEPHASSSLIESENTIITPHIASLTHESEENMIEFAVGNFLKGIYMNQPLSPQAQL